MYHCCHHCHLHCGCCPTWHWNWRPAPPIYVATPPHQIQVTTTITTQSPTTHAINKLAGKK